MNLDTTIIIDGVTIAKYGDIARNIEANETSNRTLGGNLYTDHRNNLRSWVVSWEMIKREDYDVIYNLYLDQYNENRYAVVRFEAFDVSIPAKIEISQHNIKHNASVIKNFTLTIKEQFAFS